MTFLERQQDTDQEPHEAGGQGRTEGSLDVDDLVWEDEAQFVNTQRSGWRVLLAAGSLIGLVVIGFVIYTGARAWFAAQLDPEGEPGAEVTFNVPSGATTGDISSLMESSDIIPNSTFFRYYAEYKDFSNFQAGEYIMRENMSADEAIAVLLEGPKQVETGEFLIPEGLWLDEILELTADQIPSVTAAELRAVISSGQVEPRYRPASNNSWEGLLFPAKYFINVDITPVEVIALMSNEFAAVTGELGYGGAEREHGLSAYQVIIIASLIEAEAKTDADRPRISSVIHNRLADGEGLGIDATLIYGKQVRGEPPTAEELATPGPYNTRHGSSVGLPPTPIAAPGRASLEAAMNPLESEWKYYVLKDTRGNHAFAETLEEHNVNKAAAAELGLLDG